MIKRSHIITGITTLAVGGTATPVFAQIWDGRYTVTCNQSGQGPCTFCDALQVVANIVDFLIEISVVLGTLMIVAGAIIMMVSSGDQGRYRKGKDAITSAVIGVVIALTAWIIINTVLHILTGDPNFPWAAISC